MQNVKNIVLTFKKQKAVWKIQISTKSSIFTNCRKKHPLTKLPPLNIGLLEQQWLNNHSEPKDNLFYNFIKKNGISFILNRNLNANELLAKPSSKEKSYLLNKVIMSWFFGR